jgi:hypothetical protein
MSCGGCVNHAVVAALHASMVLVARDQQNRMTALFDGPADWRRRIDRNLAAVVYGFPQRQLQTRAVRNETVQIDHRAVLP